MPMAYGCRSLTDTCRGRTPFADRRRLRSHADCGPTPIKEDWNETPAARRGASTPKAPMQTRLHTRGG